MHHRTIAVAVLTLACGANFNAALAADTVETAAAAPEAPAWTGHVDLVSRYVLRGITSTYGPGAPLGNAGADAPESDKPALQWGADWSDPSGFYAGYFGAMINYSYKRLGQSYSDRSIVDFQHDKSIENDLYGGYNGKVGDFSYTLGMTGSVYINGRHSNALETKVVLGYGEFTLGAQTLLNDVVWGNKGDTYWTLNFTHPLPYAITLNASLGVYSYNKQGKFLGGSDTALPGRRSAGVGRMAPPDRRRQPADRGHAVELEPARHPRRRQPLWREAKKPVAGLGQLWLLTGRHHEDRVEIAEMGGDVVMHGGRPSAWRLWTALAIPPSPRTRPALTI